MGQIRNYRLSDSKSEILYSRTVTATIHTYEQFDYNKNSWVNKKEINSTLSNPFLNLKICNDGSNFTSLNQALNEAKYIVYLKQEGKLKEELYKNGIKPESLFKYNSLKIWDRVDKFKHLSNDY